MNKEENLGGFTFILIVRHVDLMTEMRSYDSGKYWLLVMQLMRMIRYDFGMNEMQCLIGIKRKGIAKYSVLGTPSQAH